MAKITKIYTSNNPAPTIPVDAGRSLVPTYREVKPADHYSYLEYIGDNNMDEQIKSFDAAVDLSRKIALFQSGDQDALKSGTPGFFADITNAPKNLMQAMKISMSIQENYDSLPDKVKNVFGSIDSFRDSVFDRTFEAKLYKAYSDEVKQEVKKNDSEE